MKRDGSVYETCCVFVFFRCFVSPCPLEELNVPHMGAAIDSITRTYQGRRFIFFASPPIANSETDGAQKSKGIMVEMGSLSISVPRFAMCTLLIVTSGEPSMEYGD